MLLQTPIADGGRSLKMYAKRLEKLNITTIQDLLFHIPFRYEDYSLISQIATVQVGETVTLHGQVLSAKTDYTRRFKTVQKVTLADESGSIQLTWFNQPYIVKSLLANDSLAVSGRVELFSNKLTLVSPDYELIREGFPLIHTGRIIPIYPETSGVSSKWLRRQISSALAEILPTLKDHLPSDIIKDQHLWDLSTALQQIHFPDSFAMVEKAKIRLAFDELFLLQLTALKRKQTWSSQKKGVSLSISQNDLAIFIDSLPFTLTPSQQNALNDILRDIEQEKPMNRLLQGDVGSGKTVVAAGAMYTAYKNGYQSALMAPTEILAQQHYTTIKTFLEPFGVKVDLRTGSTKGKTASGKGEKKERNPSPTTVNPDVIVGTHALVAKGINFDKLGVVIIDEQQRFGVEQRGILREKGTNPHVLTMTATPIPRTVALTLYGELDVSYLLDMPKGRRLIKTWLVPPVKREGAYDWIRKEIQTHTSQVFIICPFIEESENMLTVKAAAKEFERLKTDVFPDLKLGLLHGKLKSKEKETVLADFREKKFNILVATPVVEVGIDIPNATIILIEAAERFGLAQLHQLRGRVGRGDKQSYCLLFTESKSEQAQSRLKAMETMNQGAELAEFDLKMRGPGDMYGLRQSGTRMLKIASFSDLDLIERAKRAAVTTLPQLGKYPLLLQKIEENTTKTVSPD